MELLRALWPLVRKAERRSFMTSDLVVDLLRDWGEADE